MDTMLEEGKNQNALRQLAVKLLDVWLPESVAYDGSSELANLEVNFLAQVILLTDADVDGAHIRTLLLTFLFRWQSELFRQGSIYVGMPPLYKVEAGRKSRYCYDDSERDAAIAEFGGKPQIQRFKVTLHCRDMVVIHLLLSVLSSIEIGAVLCNLWDNAP